ncbi:uncharacterized protein LOC116293048 [Actinia tenebrosa]|uniref:Uncharacterized protein LOC116293048 n=1 Tax=Actinia tenebrosa TaxID=6105 RepID=A0A6P8HIT6_ACTTE|nr:uncharacterized protein LOC116293048 [Actinia tenebrosa]
MHVTLTSIKRAFDCFIITVFGIVSFTLLYRPTKLFPLYRKIIEKNKHIVSPQPLDVSDDGFHFNRQAPQHDKFLSYEPPIGSWSDQLLAFQNAVIIATLLNRTLLAQPLVSELVGKRLRSLVRVQLKSDSEVYKLMTLKFTVPISAVINIRLLNRLLRVKPIQSTYMEFLQEYMNFSWHDVCHKDNLGFWVDFIPSPKNTFAWKILEAQEFVPVKSYFSGVEPVCEEEIEMIDHNMENTVPVLRGILTELAAVQKDVIYFRGGSIAARELRFLSKKRTAQAQMWIMKYIQFSSYVQEKISAIVHNIKKPYNAIKLTDNQSDQILDNIIRFRLKEMEKKSFQNITNRLYVISEFKNKKELSMLKDKGYELYSITDLVPQGVSENLRYDVQKLLGELISKHARYFEGPQDSYMIQRARVHEAHVQDGLLTSLISVKWVLHTINRNKRITARKSMPERTIAHNGLVIFMCKLCRTMQSRLRQRTCRSALNECDRRYS